MLLLDLARALLGDVLRAAAKRVDPAGEMMRRLREAADDEDLENLGAPPVVSPEAAAMVAKPEIRIEHGFRDLDDPNKVEEVLGRDIARASKKGRRVVAGGH